VEPEQPSVGKLDSVLPGLPDIRLKLPFLIAGFASFVFSVLLYFAFDEKTAGIFVGLWVPSIHSLGTLLLTRAAPVDDESTERREVARS
jgi:hypothetical protein